MIFIVLGMKQKVVKGITHCLLPQCSNVTWPFMNYCRRTHAEEGKKLGLKREFYVRSQIVFSYMYIFMCIRLPSPFPWIMYIITDRIVYTITPKNEYRLSRNMTTKLKG